jgi:zinc protease
VSTGLARSAGSGTSLHIDPHLWTFSATALPGIAPERIEAAIEAEIERLASTPAAEDEFAKARKQIRAQYVYSRETVTAQAFWLGQMEIIDHAGRVDTLADELAQVTPEDVQRVVRTWLVKDQRTVGWQLPDDEIVKAGAEIPVGDVVEPEAHYSAEPQLVWGLSGTAPSVSGFVRTELPNGIVLLAQPRPGDEAIEGTISIAAGQSATGESRAGLPSMTAKMLNRGTATRTFEEFNEAIDRLGAVIGADADRDYVDISFHSLAEDLDPVLQLAAEVIRTPTFPEEELAKVRQQTLTGIREQESDTGAMASKLLREMMYPEGHPYRLRVSGEIETVSAFTSADLAAYHAHAFGPAVTTIALVGGIDSLDEAVMRIERVFGDWAVKVGEPGKVPPIDPPASTARRAVMVRGKSQADLAIAFPTLARSLEPEYFAVNMANTILGQLGLMGRLGANVRDKQGLAYYAYSSFSGGEANSIWSARAGVDPGNVERALESIVHELGRLHGEPVTESELADVKSYAIGSLPLAVESLGGVVSLLLSIERHGLGLDYLERYPGYISALTADDLLSAARRHLDPTRLTVAVAGPERDANAGE